MKVGILTFHSQLNYGGVLQAYALQHFLRQAGHDALIIDRWLDEKNAKLKGPFARFNLRGWLTVLLRGLDGCGAFGRVSRHWKTIRFIRQWLLCTSYHFYNWKDAPADLGTEVIVVGSDQVWHCGDWGNPLPYLLEGAPNIKTVSYAASFGMLDIPEDWKHAYCSGLARFKAISVREEGAARIIRRLGFRAETVVDPTLLVDKSAWTPFLRPKRLNSRQTLVCYYIAEEISNQLSDLMAFARSTGADVLVFVDSDYRSVTWHVLRRIQEIVRLNLSHVHIAASADPGEFVSAIANATWVVADSFHALMFATIFGRNSRIIRPREENRRRMFERIEEFVQKCLTGTVIVESLSQALSSLQNEKCAYNREAITQEISKSRKWILETLSNI